MIRKFCDRVSVWACAIGMLLNGAAMSLTVATTWRLVEVEGVHAIVGPNASADRRRRQRLPVSNRTFRRFPGSRPRPSHAPAGFRQCRPASCRRRLGARPCRRLRGSLGRSRQGHPGGPQPDHGAARTRSQIPFYSIRIRNPVALEAMPVVLLACCPATRFRGRNGKCNRRSEPWKD